MHTWFDPLLIYGWREGNRDGKICEEWLEEHNMKEYALDVVRGYLGEAVYGLPCQINEDTGLPIISDEDRLQVQKAYQAFTENDTPSEQAPKLGFYIALTGDYMSEHYLYRP